MAAVPFNFYLPGSVPPRRNGKQFGSYRRRRVNDSGKYLAGHLNPPGMERRHKIKPTLDHPWIGPLTTTGLLRICSRRCTGSGSVTDVRLSELGDHHQPVPAAPRRSGQPLFYTRRLQRCILPPFVLVPDWVQSIWRADSLSGVFHTVRYSIGKSASGQPLIISKRQRGNLIIAFIRETEPLAFGIRDLRIATAILISQIT